MVRRRSLRHVLRRQPESADVCRLEAERGEPAWRLAAVHRAVPRLRGDAHVLHGLHAHRAQLQGGLLQHAAAHPRVHVPRALALHGAAQGVDLQPVHRPVLVRRAAAAGDLQRHGRLLRRQGVRPPLHRQAPHRAQPKEELGGLHRRYDGDALLGRTHAEDVSQIPVGSAMALPHLHVRAVDEPGRGLHAAAPLPRRRPRRARAPLHRSRPVCLRGRALRWLHGVGDQARLQAEGL
mmetsp:Transcript_71339/g.189784  ORF Transcript_71339/g.189784 Transcript_71339/m.189784 type:complete len:236 (+) Transcript_71339:130-837(+)